MSAIEVLCVDDDPQFLDALSDFLETEDFSVTTRDDPEEALNDFRDGGFDCVVSDYDMPEMSGIELLEEIRASSDIPFIMFTGKGTEKVASEAITKDVTDYILKGSDDERSRMNLLANRIEGAVEKKRTEEQLEDANERYTSLVEDAPVSILVHNGVEIFYANQTAAETVGADSVDELIGMNPLDFFAEEDREDILERLSKTYHGDRDEHQAVEKFTDLEGNERYCFVNTSTVMYEGQKALQVVAQDVTEELVREKELERYKSIVEAAGDAVYTLDEDGRIDHVNDYFVSFTGYPRQDLIGKKLDYVIDESEKVEESIEELLEGDVVVSTYEVNLRSAGGDTVPCEVRTTLLPFEDEYEGTVGIIRDISKRKKREEKLEDFASVVSHDLRNPLSVISANLELGRRKGDDKYFERIEKSLNRMENIIDDLLTLARQGDEVGETQEIELERTAESAWFNVETSNAELEVEDDTFKLEADPGRLKTLLENLYRNSIEHGSRSPGSQSRQESIEHNSPNNQTESDHSAEQDGPKNQTEEEKDVEHSTAEIEVTVGSLEDSAGFYVEDNGTGIPNDKREKIFEHGYSTMDEGTGFGLSIVEAVAEAHGWEVRITESETDGARFEVLFNN